ncbi:MAG: peptidoglycan-associated lipoprotein Pal [Alphaproteobacteria bacterium]|nr:peptidoglycan-associated lipoprotein Pal [Alphaproteobacteria bacterium]MDP6564299.1 peptidoglycan-associated lipoprotein Pal [Alphaproteobacteria bacterium]MDP6811834.1 peptidoglycan-associated lipoprotein Pal [Alphaproteobacteria bacterium]
MVFEKFGLKAVSMAAVMLLVAACETPVEEKAETSGTGAAQQKTTTAAAPKAEPKVTMESKVIPGSQEDLVLNVGDRVFFDFDKSDLKQKARQTVERWSEWMKQHPAVTVTVQGHCDERGTREYNLGLGERRADSVRKYLIALGVNADRVGTISYGKERPVCVSSNEGCWSQNRRGVMVVN